MSLKYIRTIEKNIRTKMKKIEKGELTLEKSEIGKQFNRLKDMDEASYEHLLKEYIILTKKLKS